MQSFTSDISQKKFPVEEFVSGKAIRNGVLKEIQKDYPAFDEESKLAASELSYYRQLYIQNLLAREVGTLTELELTVLDNINQNHLISDEASEIKNPGSRGERWADRIASFGGSWKFIGLFGLFLGGWMALNSFSLHNKGFDPYPYILLNLLLSCLAAIQAPVIMMSQNRQEAKDRLRARNDYMVNLKGELEVRILHEKIDHLIISQRESLADILELQQQLLQVR
ncbi:MAG: DUF1003 domain-containing protein [Sphingobacteriales bacterium]|jgi:uncharacterized membrane protein|nr:DUF1003 domain-containing protein [Sphingobacteriales bacterium]NCT75184.1 DUF1003 domain-containing protein [Chitinophagaceae bacterium]OJW31818.1 MAG: hypothetical protein BGO54_15390 [Sphingobacteriales bacterium 46-32]